MTETTRYGTAAATAWDRLHPQLTRRAAWTGYPDTLPIIEGTVIRLQVDRLPSGGEPKPLWLWWSKVDAIPADVDRLWQAFLRRFDLEHTFRLFKQTLGWTAPKLRDPASADRCDLDPLNPGNVTPLSDVDALAAIKTVSDTAHGIDPYCYRG